MKDQMRGIDLLGIPSQLQGVNKGGRPVVGVLPQGSFSAYTRENTAPCVGASRRTTSIRRTNT